MTADAVGPNARPDLFGGGALGDQKLTIALSEYVAREGQVQAGISRVAFEFRPYLTSWLAVLVYKHYLFGLVHALTIALLQAVHD